MTEWGLLQRLLGRGNEAKRRARRRFGRRRAQWRQVRRPLQEVEKEDLGLEHQGLDFVEEECPTVGLEEASNPLLGGAGKSAPEVAKQLAVEMGTVGRKRAAVDVDEAPLGPAELVNEVGRVHFPRAGGAEQEDRPVHTARPVDGPLQRPCGQYFHWPCEGGQAGAAGTSARNSRRLSVWPSRNVRPAATPTGRPWGSFVVVLSPA